ncbi:MAG: restriction endonuclease-like protein [Bacteroides sp.]|nr:restriction endonuclease-like protein [Bacteroides sp.]
MTEICIPVALREGGVVELRLYGREGTLQALPPAEAEHLGESPYRLQEGTEYEYTLPGGYQLEEEPALVVPSRIRPSEGKIRTGSYTGIWRIEVLYLGRPGGWTEVEIFPGKMDYRTDYRRMLEEITEHCTEILLQRNSPVSQYLLPEGPDTSRTLYQRFAFVRSVVGSEEFEGALQKILSAPVARWSREQEDREIWRGGRLRGNVLNHIASARERVPLPAEHRLASTIHSLPARMRFTRAGESVDTPENQFVKYVLRSFLTFCEELNALSQAGERVSRESRSVMVRLEQWLGHGMWQEVGELRLLPLHSPVLQRREGYREVLRFWLMFDLASRLIWEGGEDVYAGGKRDVAVLYEYWLFFKLAAVVGEVFGLRPDMSALLQVSEGGWSVRLRRGQHVAVAGIYEHPVRRLNVELSYNRTFRGDSPYPEGGSWTHDMRPDYTLSIWPAGIGQEQAEREELIVHLHFDAKYRIDRLADLFGEEGREDEDRRDAGRTRLYKRDDMLKMHAYRDSIRRTAGAFILYPGVGEGHRRYRSFHEILPGIGAFAIHPSRSSGGLEELRGFLKEVTEHFLNRTSRREKLSYYTYRVNRPEERASLLQEPLPELLGKDRGLFADETTVLVGWYRDEAQLQWIVREGLYNLRTGSRQGSVRLSPAFTGARYLLLHTQGEGQTSRLMRIVPEGPRIFSRAALLRKGYPEREKKVSGTKAEKQTEEELFYLVYKVEEVTEPALAGQRWDVRKLPGYRGGRQAAGPFTVTLAELVQVKIRNKGTDEA